MRRPLLARAIVAATLSSTAAAAQALAPTPAVPPPYNGSATTAAPTPSVAPERVAPADRAGNNTTDPAGPVASTPFSAGPQGGAGSQISPASRETEPSGSPSTPNLGR